MEITSERLPFPLGPTTQLAYKTVMHHSSDTDVCDLFRHVVVQSLSA